MNSESLLSVFKKNSLIRETEFLSEDEDSFGFAVRAKNFVEYIKTYDFPLTVGVYGAWGTGKTVFARFMQNLIETKNTSNQSLLESSMLGFMKQSIKTKNTVWFNAVDYKSSGEKISGYLLKSITQKNSVIQWVSVVFFSIFSAFILVFLFVASSYLGFFSPGIFALLSFYGLTKLPGNFDLESIKSITDIFEQKIKLCLLKKFDHAKKFVFIDNVDRLEPKQALQFLEELKSFFASKNNKFSNYCFVVLCDPQILEKDIQDIYGDKVKPSDYLDKLLEIPFVLPAKTDDQRSGFFKNIFIDSVTESQIAQIREVAKDFGLTIRDVKSYLHELGMLFQKAEDEAEKNKFVELIDKFFVLLVLRKKNKDVFDFYESTKKLILPDEDGIGDSSLYFLLKFIKISEVDNEINSDYTKNTFSIHYDRNHLESRLKISSSEKNRIKLFEESLKLVCSSLSLVTEDFEFIFNFFAR